MASFEPYFQPTTNGWRSRWNAIRMFANRWYRLRLGSASAPREIPGYPLASQLPPSVRQWIVFHEDTKRRPLCRDNVRVERIKSPKSISIMELVEQDVCWVIREPDLSHDDPPVTAVYESSYDDDFAKKWGRPHTYSPTVTEFALGCVIHSLHSETGGCFFTIEESMDQFLGEMKNGFRQKTRFGNMTIFESPGQIAFVYNSIFGPQFNLQLRRKIQRDKLPDCILRNLEDAGKFGCLAASLG